MWSDKPQISCSQQLRLHGLTSSDLGLRTWDLVWSDKPQLPCSQRLRLHGLTSSDLGLRTWDLVWSDKPQLPCSQRLRLHGLTSSDLGLRTWDPVRIGPYSCSPSCVKRAWKAHYHNLSLQSANLECGSLFAFVHGVKRGLIHLHTHKYHTIKSWLVYQGKKC